MRDSLHMDVWTVLGSTGSVYASMRCKSSMNIKYNNDFTNSPSNHVFLRHSKPISVAQLTPNAFVETKSSRPLLRDAL